MKIFRELNPREEFSFRKWARENYKPFDDIKGVWHPIVQEECTKINVEAKLDLETKFHLSNGNWRGP